MTLRKLTKLWCAYVVALLIAAASVFMNAPSAQAADFLTRNTFAGRDVTQPTGAVDYNRGIIYGLKSVTATSYYNTTSVVNYGPRVHPNLSEIEMQIYRSSSGDVDLHLTNGQVMGLICRLTGADGTQWVKADYRLGIGLVIGYFPSWAVHVPYSTYKEFIPRSETTNGC